MAKATSPAPLRVLEAGTYTIEGTETHRVILEGSRQAVAEAARLLYQAVKVAPIEEGNPNG